MATDEQLMGMPIRYSYYAAGALAIAVLAFMYVFNFTTFFKLPAL